jgi:hypothetical protein
MTVEVGEVKGASEPSGARSWSKSDPDWGMSARGPVGCDKLAR